MALFVVRHQHAAETCPARDPRMGAMLLSHLAEPSAREHGVTVHSEAVLDGQHTLYLIAEAASQDVLDRYLQPFGMVGSVEIWRASECSAVVARGGCEAVSF